MDEEKQGEVLPSRIELMRPIVRKLISGEMKLSYTALSHFIDSPKDFAQYKLIKQEPTEAMIYGKMVHCLILEPDKFNSRFFTFDDSDKVAEIGGAKPRATKAYKEWKAIVCADAGMRTIISPQDHVHAKIVAQNVLYNRASRRIMEKCPKRERPVEWDYMNFGWHGYIDLEGDEDIADIKTLPDANRKKAQRAIWDRGYYIQGALYRLASGSKKNIHIIAVDKIGGISVHTLHERLLEFAMEELRYYVERFNHAVITEAWDESQDFYSDRWDGTFECDKAGWMYAKD